MMPPTQLTPMPFPRPSCPYPNVHRSATSPARFRRSTKYYPKETQGFCTHPFPKTGNGLLFMCQKLYRTETVRDFKPSKKNRGCYRLYKIRRQHLSIGKITPYKRCGFSSCRISEVWNKQWRDIQWSHPEKNTIQLNIGQEMTMSIRGHDHPLSNRKLMCRI